MTLPSSNLPSSSPFSMTPPAAAASPAGRPLPSRRSALVGGVALGAGLLSGCSVTGATKQAGAGGSGSGTINVLFMQQAGYSIPQIKSMTAAFNKLHPGIKANETFVTYEALHDKIVTAAAAGTYDVVLIDVIWPAEFATKNIVADVTDRYPASWKTDMVPGALTTALYKGKQYGMTWGLDTKFFYYNTKMLAKAGVESASLQSWDGVLTAAKAVKAKAGVKYPLVWSWSQAEAIMCDYSQLVGAFGGTLVDDNGDLAINSGGGVEALEWMRKTIVDGLTNPASTTSLEGDVQKTLNNGQAAFGLNWTYYLDTSTDATQSKVVGDIAIQQTPAGPSGKRPGVNGAMAMAMTEGSKNQDAAWTFISYMGSQKAMDAQGVAVLPDWKGSYSNQSLVKQAPQTFAAASKQLGDIILRPQVANYNAVSQVIQVGLQKALLGQLTPQKALDQAVTKATALLKS